MKHCTTLTSTSSPLTAFGLEGKSNSYRNTHSGVIIIKDMEDRAESEAVIRAGTKEISGQRQRLTNAVLHNIVRHICSYYMMFNYVRTRKIKISCSDKIRSLTYYKNSSIEQNIPSCYVSLDKDKMPPYTCMLAWMKPTA